jgi:hypothetical protein
LSLSIPTVIGGLIISGSFFKSAIAANGKPQLATKKKINKNLLY